jgi:DNA (cytosine-5)-methyltransferase 1
MNPSCQKVYQRNFGDTPYGDITQINPIDIPDFDILTAGFPCQPFSLCGKKEGFNDQIRGTLFFNVAEIIKIKSPKMVLLENVKGIVTHDNGKTLCVIKETLRNLGYTLHTKVLNTYDFGIPQNRERWYCVAYREEIGFTFPKGNARGTVLRDIVDVNHFEEELLFPEEELKRIDYHFKNYKKSPRVEHCNKKYNPESKKGKYGIYSYLKPDNSLRFHTGDIAKSQIQDDYYVSLDCVSPTLIATRAPKMWDLRRHLSVAECKRLQGFPESYDFTDVSIKSAKKQLGNAVTVKVVESIAAKMIQNYQNKINNNDNNIKILNDEMLYEQLNLDFDEALNPAQNALIDFIY